MIKQSKAIYIIGSIIIGVVSVVLIFAGLFLSGVIDARSVKLVYTTGSKSAVYDGTEISCDEWELISGTLKKGHTAQVKVVGKRTDAGVSANGLSVTITDLNGADVTSDYTIEVQAGVLQVDPRPIIIQTRGASKKYDGEPLTNDEWELVSLNNILEGDELEVKVIGSQTTVGESENTADVRVLRGDTDVTHNYQITVQAGTLRIKSATEGGGDGPGEGGYGPGEGGGDGPGIKDDDDADLSNRGQSDLNTPVGTIITDKDGTVYLRINSYGVYNGKGFGVATEYDGKLEGNYGLNYLTGIALANSGAQKYRATITPKPSSGFFGYVLPYYLSTDSGCALQESDVYYNGDISKSYSVEFYDYTFTGESTKPSGGLGKYTDAEAAYREFVYTAGGQYLTLPENTLQYINTIISENDWSLKDPTVINKIAYYVQNAATYNLKYDSALDEESDMIVAFLQKYKEGVCRHYAAAATAIYRAMGIPARYTIGYSVDVKANQEENIIVGNGHAWVEVYIAGLGWVHVEVTGGSDPGDSGDPGGSDPGGSGGSGKRITLNFEVKSLDKLYDGEPLLPDGLSSSSNATLKYLKDKGYLLEYTITGSQTEVGKSSAVISNIKITKDGEDCTNLFEIKTTNGTLHVYQYEEIIVMSESATKTYDGTVLRNDAYTYSGFLQEGHELNVTFTSKEYKVGVVANVFNVSISDSEGNDVTVYYKVKKVCGSLTINRRTITVISDSAEQYYDESDPKALTKNEYSLADGSSLATGDVLFMEFSGTQTDIGSSENKFKVKIVNILGKDVTDCYVITKEYGTLTVKPPRSSD